MNEKERQARARGEWERLKLSVNRLHAIAEDLKWRLETEGIDIHLPSVGTISGEANTLEVSAEKLRLLQQMQRNTP